MHERAVPLDTCVLQVRQSVPRGNELHTATTSVIQQQSAGLHRSRHKARQGKANGTIERRSSGSQRLTSRRYSDI